MTVISTTIPNRSHVMLLRMTPDAKLLAFYQCGESLKDSSLEVVEADENYGNISYVSRRKEAGKEDSISPIFDISPNGRYLAVCYHETYGSVYRSGCYLWDVKQEAYLPNFIHKEMRYKSYLDGNGGQGYHYLAVQFSSDNERLMTVSDMGEIFVWSISQQKLLWAITAAAHQATAIAFGRKFSLFALSEHNYHSKLWRHGQIGQHTVANGEIFYQQYGKWIGSEPLNTQPSFRLWNAYSGTLIREFDGDYAVSDLVFSHDDKNIAGSMKETAFIWDVNTGELVDALPKNTKPIAFTSNDAYLVTIHEGNKISVWDVHEKQWIQHCELEGLISSAQVSQNDKVVALSKTINDWQLHQIQL